jgi:hypothetical protein
MRITEQTAKTTPRTGIFTTLRALLGVKGTGAPLIGAPGRGQKFALVVVGLTLLAALAGAAPASAATPWWHLESGTRPSYLPPEGGCTTPEGKATPCELVATVTNLGDTSTSTKNAKGEPTPVTITDTLPAGLSAKSVEANFLEGGGGRSKETVSCSPDPAVEKPITCRFSGNVTPYSGIELRIAVKVEPEAKAEPEAKVCLKDASSCEQNVVSVSGGGARPLSISRPVTVSEQVVPFGVESYEVTPEEEGGAPTTQAGQHPFQVTGTLTVNQLAVTPSLLGGPGFVEGHPAGAISKDLAGLLPPGLIGNPTPFPTCTLVDFFAEEHCPARSVVGVAVISFNEPRAFDGLATQKVPIVKLEPARGEAARFGFLLTAATPVFLDAHVRTGSDYGVTLSSSNITQLAALLNYKLTFWGVPGDPEHDSARGTGCLHGNGCVPLEAEVNPPPLLAMPTSCTGQPLLTSIEGDSWSEPEPEGHRQIFPETEPMPTMVGCNRLPFEPQIEITPDRTAGSTGTAASTATGLTADVHVPQQSILNGASLAQSDVRNITVALPPGVALNPSDAGGLEACSSNPSALSENALGSPGDQIGFKGFEELATEPGTSNPIFTPYLPGSLAAIGEAEDHQITESEATLQPGVNFCPSASKVGTVKLKTPLLPNPVEGAVYLAAQEANPFDSVIAMYIVAEDKVSGSLVKLPGEVSLCKNAGDTFAGMTCEAPGQIITSFENNPQVAFEDAELHFFGGERSPLATPARCGSYTTHAAFVPWSAEPWDEAAVTVDSSSTFDITSGPNHSPCPGTSLPFSPTVTGGATNINAGAFSPFTATFSRSDGEQNMQSIVAKLPPGLSGILSGVELCPEPQANLGTCTSNSLIGESTVSVGVGGQPYSVRGGKFYLTGPYNGTGTCNVIEPGCAPFGITFEVPAKAGPFDLAKTANNHPACDCVIVRAKIEVNPLTTAITITSNPPGTPDSIPTSIEGIPLQIQHVNATTTRGNFQFNPTNCNKFEVTGTIQTSEGATDTLGVPLQVTNCAALKFEPKFTASTQAKTSKSEGASLTLKVTRPSGPGSGQANFALAKIELPEQLPSRLTTLQKACTAAQFESNPAGCPAASNIGYVKVQTPILPVPLEGPAYFVSHGGEAFPSVIFVLQGYGVTVDVVSTTFISKSGITSATIKAVPDAPFTSFELNFPEKQYSALAANGNLCAPTGTKTVKKRVPHRVHGKLRYLTKNVKETVPTSLVMPTEFIAQNGEPGQSGTVIKQNTPITVTGCPKAVKVKKSTKKKKKGKSGKGHK